MKSLPPGIKVNTNILQGKTNLKISTALSFDTQTIRIPKSRIQSELIGEILGGKFLLKGFFQLESLLKIKNGKPVNGSIKLKSTNLKLPSQAIQSFNFPMINLGNFLLKGNYQQSGKFLVQEFIIGNQDSPILAKITGSIQVNQNHITESILNLEGKVKFSKSFQKKFPILNLLIGGKKTDKNGFFNLTLTGPLGRAKHQFL